MEVHMATGNDTQTVEHESGMSAAPATIESYKDALCFALDAKAVLKAAANAHSHARLNGAASSMERLCRDMIGFEDFSHEQRLSIANEIRTMAHNVACINDGGADEEMLDDPLLYAVETLFDLAIFRLENEEKQHA
jgi:hypothetical protein